MFRKLFIAFLAAMACVHAQEKDITEIDPNFRQATIGNREVRFADVRKAPFVLTGFAFRKSEDGKSRSSSSTNVSCLHLLSLLQSVIT